MSSRVALSSVRKGVRGAPALARIGDKTHILLNNLPKTATPADVLRMARRFRIENVIGATLDYHYFEPSGQAYLEISKSEFMLDALKTLDGCSMTGLSLTSYPCDARPIRRLRGQAGRNGASNRGIVKGDGPAASIQASGQEVIVIGLPQKTTPDEFKAYLTENKLVEEGLDGKGLCEVLATEPPISAPASGLRTRMYVRLKSAYAAHELAKRLNMTYYDPFRWRSRMPIKARVLY